MVGIQQLVFYVPQLIGQVHMDFVRIDQTFGLIPQGFQLPSAVGLDVHYLGSVSYTHLDVYKRQGKPIVYSLGNFVFGSSIPKTALLTADWDGENLSLVFVPGTSSGGYTRPLTGEDEKQMCIRDRCETVHFSDQ